MTATRSTFGAALLVSLALAFAMFASTDAQAPRLNVKLGLWEATTVVQTSGAPPIDTSKMTPEQRQRVEAMLENSRKRAAQPHILRTCLTEDKLDKMPFENRNDKSCTHEVVTSSSTEYAVKFTCEPQEGASMSGEWHFQALTPEAVKGNGTVTMERAGQKMESASTITAKWVGPSCGDVK